ncbi:hypothetical protein BDZ91DRAFT_719067 [Kalaharituber pfeilii]|nr:hypothetical protein BDZ91DRAFT_719067 [Kalaharituber pfeilii]
MLSSSFVKTALSGLLLLGTIVASHPAAKYDAIELLRRQFPDERRNLTFDDILIPNENYCNSAKLPVPYQEYIFAHMNASATCPSPNLPRVFNTTITANCREHADHQGPFWRAYSLPNVITTGGSLNLTRAGPWREGGFGVLTLALGTEKDMEPSGQDPTGAVVRVYFAGISRTGNTIATNEVDFPAPPTTWGNYGPWFITTTAGFDIGLREFHVWMEYRWTRPDGSKAVKPVSTVWIDHVQVRIAITD